MLQTVQKLKKQIVKIINKVYVIILCWRNESENCSHSRLLFHHSYTSTQILWSSRCHTIWLFFCCSQDDALYVVQQFFVNRCHYNPFYFLWKSMIDTFLLGGARALFLQQSLVETLSQSGHNHQSAQTTEPDVTKPAIWATHAAFSQHVTRASVTASRGGAARLITPSISSFARGILIIHHP